MYKISDIRSEVWRRTSSLFDNHLFLLFFIVFILFIGTFGIWVTPLLVKESVTWEALVNSFNTLNLLSFVLPLLMTLIFDKIVTVTSKSDKDDVTITIWFSVLFLVIIIGVAALFVLGHKIDGTDFSWYSFTAWILVLYVWVLGNVDNPNYQKSDSVKAPTGGDDVDRSKMGKE